MADHVAAPGPITSVDPRVEARLNTAGRLFRWLALGFGLIGMVGTINPYFQDLPPGPGVVRDLPLASAISLTVLALGALIAGGTTNALTNVAWRRIGLVMTLCAAAFGGFVIYIFFANRTDIWGGWIAVPAFSVGVILVVLGVAVPLSVSRIEWRIIAGQVGALLVFSLTAAIFLGYVYGDPSVGRFFLQPAISFQASLISVLAAVGVFLMRPASGLLSTASSPGAGGRLLRLFGPVVLLTPALILLITELVPSTDRVDVLAFVSVGFGLFLLILLSFFVRALDETAIEAATAAAEARRAQTGLEQEAPVVSGMSDMFHIVDLDGVQGWDVATRFRPGVGAVAGDTSAVCGLPDGTIGAVLVDLTGHGADPAVLAIRLRDILFQTMVAGRSPTEALQLVGWSVPDDVLASAIVFRLDPSSGEVTLSSAGHPPAIVVSSQEATLKSPTGPLLYLEHSTLYEEHSFVLGEGDTLVAFSDGIADVQRTVNGRTEPEMLADLLLAEGGQAARTADLVLGFADPEPNDDQTVVVLRRSP
ncbi:MAG TPA: PP2C family protein-serine/threonine phosphatase [Acidimicrobiia bacterium]|nr:PP2C family protein-serine/threonine phosphatase [Acidimicrobiia bacterium]